MSTRFLAALAAACILASMPVRADEAGPKCLTAADAATNARAHGAVMARLDGPEAAHLLNQINSVGQPTDYHAETVIVILRPETAVVAMFSPCHGDDVRMMLQDFADVWVKARGVRV